MTMLKLFGAATILSALASSPVSAQSHMIDEPGMFAFVYPNGDLGLGAPRQATDAMAMSPRLIMRHPLPLRRAKPDK